MLPGSEMVESRNGWIEKRWESGEATTNESAKRVPRESRHDKLMRPLEGESGAIIACFVVVLLGCRVLSVAAAIARASP